MAIWQFDFHAVKHGSTADNIMLWNIPFEDINHIYFLKQERSWMDDTIQYGNLEEDCIEISLSNGLVESIFIRIDVRDINKEKISNICSYLKEINADILYGNRVLSANEKDLEEVIVKSNGYRFFQTDADIKI